MMKNPKSQIQSFDKLRPSAPKLRLEGIDPERSRMSQNPKIRGQVMLLTVLILGGSLIAASTIAGYLMLLKIRQSSNIANSAKAIFAADTGIEWDLYKRLKDDGYPKPQLSNSASFEVFAEPTSTKSIGTVSNISRAFELTF